MKSLGQGEVARLLGQCMGWRVGWASGVMMNSLLWCVVALKKVMEFMVMGFLSGKLHIIIGIL